MGGVDVGGGDEVDVLEDEVDEAVDEFGCYLVCLIFFWGEGGGRRFC